MEEKLDAFQRVSLNKKLTMQPNKYLQVIAILTGLITINSCTANKQINGTKTVVTIESDSVITDPQGNSYLLKTMPDNLLWMTNNLQLNIENSLCSSASSAGNSITDPRHLRNAAAILILHTPD